MSDLGLDLDPQDRPRRARRGLRRHGLGCLAVLLAFAVLAGGAWFVFDAGVSALRDRFDPPADYDGPGRGSVLVEVSEGDSAADIGAELEQKRVVASVEAFTDAALADPDSKNIQVGFYELRREMPAKAALAVLVDPENLVQSAVTVREGLTVDETVGVLAKGTDFSRAEYRKVLRRPGSLGLPAYARGNPEGYLFPATYQIPPNATPRSVLRMMVDRYDEAAAKLDLRGHASRLGVSPHDVVTVASLVQAEARFARDFPKVSRVIYNRLEEPMKLQFDSTVHYAVGRDGGVGTSDSDRSVDSPYNTYRYAGLPPGPINAPGEQALRAAVSPATGPWLYFVTTDPDSGVTKFAEDYQDHLRNKREFEDWCRESPNC